MIAGIAEAFQVQLIASRELGSPLYAELLEHALDDFNAGGPVAELFEGWQGNPIPDAVVLRFLGAVHRRVLDGDEPELARHYPSIGGSPEWPQLWETFRAVVEQRREQLRPYLSRQVQTNEVTRSAALLGGFLQIAALTPLPLRLLEIGSSAGLNLFWDRYRYQLGAQGWGDPAAEVVIRSSWNGMPPAFPARVRVTERAGCDLTPVDLRDPAELRKLESFVWPDQLERLSQLRAAAGLVRRERPRLTRSSAARWLRQQLAEPVDGVATVVFHSVMWWYLSPGERDEVTALIEARGNAAIARSPIAWLQMEMLREPDKADLLLRFWPGNGQPLLLGRTHPHGREVWWE